jgi:tRNA-specific 2-thiouridylase
MMPSSPQQEREGVDGTYEELHRPEVTIGAPSWRAAPPSPGDEVQVQIRHRAPAVSARVASLSPDAVTLAFATPQRAVSPGQSAVMFSGDVVLGGGRIAS